jgi:DNA-binding CsgD family transcriptional regulator
MQPIVDECLEQMENASDLPALQGVLDQTLRDLGFDRFTYLSVRRPALMESTFFVSTYPEDWAELYTHRKYVNVDPVIAGASRALTPFAWHNEKLRSGARDKQNEFFGEAGDFGISNGITVPIHAPGGEFAALSATPDMSDQELVRWFRARRLDIHFIGLYFHVVVGQMLKAETSFSGIKLTTRERECLVWTSRGKTAWEISEILNIGESTVVSHLNSAREKFGVFSKHHAVVKAIMLGLILP